WDIAVVGYDTRTGRLLWKHIDKVYGDDQAYGIVTTADGLAVVTGKDTPYFTSDFATFALDVHTGRRMWIRHWDSPAGLDDVAGTLAVSADGERVVVAGGSFNPSYLDDSIVTIGYDAHTGDQQWVRRVHEGPKEKFLGGMAMSADGSRIFVAGERMRPGYYDKATVLTVAYALPGAAR